VATPRLTVERMALWRQLEDGVAAVQRAIDREMTEECDLPLAWFDVLTVLRERGDVRVSELVDALAEVPSSLSRRLDRMEESGYIERTATPLPTDRRAVTVRATRDGRWLWTDAAVVYRRVLQAQLGQHLTETDEAALQRIVAKFDV
jgi:DNA-binding MarR family transcriptional regulator